MAAEPFRSTYLQTCLQALVDVPSLNIYAFWTEFINQHLCDTKPIRVLQTKSIIAVISFAFKWLNFGFRPETAALRLPAPQMRSNIYHLS